MKMNAIKYTLHINLVRVFGGVINERAYRYILVGGGGGGGEAD